MKVIESTNLAELEAINKKINDYMIANIENYVGTQWGTITKHPKSKKYILKIGDDSRNPLNQLSTNEKTTVKTINKKSWLDETK